MESRVTLGSTSSVIAKGAIKMMMWAKIKLAAACVTAAVVVGGAGTPVVVNAIAQEKKAVEKQLDGKPVVKKADSVEKIKIVPEPKMKETGEYLKCDKPFNEVWRYVSETSAVIYWQTDEPATSYVEYGETDKYGRKTKTSGKSEISGKPFFSHLHRLAGLKTGRPCHYRMVIAAPETKTETRSKDAVITPKKTEGAIAIPGDIKGPPYMLKKPGYYILTKDLSVTGSAIVISGDNVTLDLDGHSIIYDQTDGTPGKVVHCGLVGAAGGVCFAKSSRPGNVRVLNGIIKQGNGGHGYDHSFGGHGRNPIAWVYSKEVEIAGITAVHNHRDVVHTILGHNACSEGHIHHNVLADLAEEEDSCWLSHRYCKSIWIRGLGYVHHNLIKRTRRTGIEMAGRIYNNEIYVVGRSGDRGIIKHKKANYEMRDNKVFGEPAPKNPGRDTVAFWPWLIKKTELKKAGPKLKEELAEIYKEKADIGKVSDRERFEWIFENGAKHPRVSARAFEFAAEKLAHGGARSSKKPVEWLWSHPKLVEWVGTHPKATDDLLRHVGLAGAFLKHPKAAEFLEKHPEVADFLVKKHSVHSFVRKLFRTDPNLAKFLKK